MNTIITDNYSLYQGDCLEVLKQIESNTICKLKNEKHQKIAIIFHMRNIEFNKR